MFYRLRFQNKKTFIRTSQGRHFEFKIYIRLKSYRIHYFLIQMSENSEKTCLVWCDFDFCNSRLKLKIKVIFHDFSRKKDSWYGALLHEKRKKVKIRLLSSTVKCVQNQYVSALTKNYAIINKKLAFLFFMLSCFIA